MQKHACICTCTHKAAAIFQQSPTLSSGFANKAKRDFLSYPSLSQLLNSDCILGLPLSTGLADI